MSNATTPFARGTGLLVIETINSNPNGDPDRESDPRQRPDGHGEISPVSFKRKIRDLMENKECLAWSEMARNLELTNPDHFRILESRGRDRKTIEKELRDGTFKEKYWDGRVFGNTFLEEGGPDTVKAGVVHFSLGLSIAPVEIARMTMTNKAGVQEGKDRGMAPLAFRVVRHGVYVMPFFVNPNTAHKTGCTANDIKLLLRLIPLGYDLNRANNRTEVFIRHAWYVEHSHPLGSCSDFKLITVLTPKKRNEAKQPSTCWNDYEVPTALDETLAKSVKPLRDLVEEAYAAASS
jgi:CRISPR-associated protein Csd2